MGIETKIIPGYCTLCRSRCGTLNTVTNGRLTSVAPRPDHPTGRANCAKGRAAPELIYSSRRLTKPLRRSAPKGAPDPCWVECTWDDALSEIATRLESIRLREGAEAIGFALTSPSATPIVDSVEWIERFAALFGSPNVCNGTEVCNWHKDVTHAFTFGAPLPTPDYRHADLIVLWGHNPANVWLSEAGEIGEACASGARLAVIDPRPISATRTAQHWLAVKPGTDAALALGLANLLITSRRYNERFVRDWSNGALLVREDTGAFLRVRDLSIKGGTGESTASGDGRRHASPDHYVVLNVCDGQPDPFDPLASPERALTDNYALRGRFVVNGIACRPAFDCYAMRCAAYPIERVAEICDIAPGLIAEMADEIASAERISYYVWTGTAQHANATQTDRAIATLFALTGTFDAPGGNVMHASAPVNRISDPALLPSAQLQKALGSAQRPLGPASKGMVTSEELYTAILDGAPYHVRGLVTFGANLLLSRADTDRGRAALQALEFSVHCDLFETPTGREADFLLPVSSPWEREALKVGFEITAAAQEHIELRPAMVAPIGESRSDAQIVCDLAVRLGFGEQMFDGDVEKGWEHVLAPLRLNVAALRSAVGGIRYALPRDIRKYARVDNEGHVNGFRTETKRVELYSEKLLRFAYDPLPDFVPVLRDRSGDEKPFPYILSCAKSGYFCHSQHRGLTSLRRRAREPLVSLGEGIADRIGVTTGDWVRVETPVGAARFKAHIEPTIAPYLAVAEFGWWQANPELGLPGYDPFSDVGSNYNRLIGGETVDPISGSSSLKSSPCNVRAVPRVGRAAPWEGARELEVIRRHDEAGDITVIDMALPNRRPLPRFLAGQHLVVAADIPGAGLTQRAYSLCNAVQGEDATFYRIGVKRQVNPSGGALSRHFAVHLRVGMTVLAQVPGGAFVIPTDVDFPIVLFAAGVGITPFLSFLESLRLGDPSKAPDVTLLYGSRDIASEAFRAELDEIARLLPSVKVLHFFSQEHDKERLSKAEHFSGRVNAAAVDQALIDRRARFWFCGPEPMIKDVMRDLIDRGVPKFDIFWEVFQSQSKPIRTQGPVDAVYKVTFAKQARTLEWRANSGVLLQFANDHGITLPSGCRVGQCENCALRVVSGEVGYDASIPEVEEDVCLTCQAIPTSDLILDG